MDNRAGSEGDWDEGKGGRNTDAFDIGGSSEVTIEGARVWNQDDCVAVNSGTASFFFFSFFLVFFPPLLHFTMSFALS